MLRNDFITKLEKGTRICMEINGLTDKGLKRELKLDSFALSEVKNYAILADGMGGHMGVEVASSLCTARLQELLEETVLPASDAESLKRNLILSDLLTDEVIRNLSLAQSSLQESCEILVLQANARGGPDKRFARIANILLKKWC